MRATTSSNTATRTWSARRSGSRWSSSPRFSASARPGQNMSCVAAKCSGCGKRLGYIARLRGFGLRERRHAARCLGVANPCLDVQTHTPEVAKEDDAHISDANSESFGVVEKREAHLPEDNEQFIEGGKATTTTDLTISTCKVIEEHDAHSSDTNAEPSDFADRREAHLSEDHQLFIERNEAVTTTAPNVSILKVEVEEDANSESSDVAQKGIAHLSQRNDDFIEGDSATTTTAPTNSIIDSSVVSVGLSDGVSKSVPELLVVSATLSEGVNAEAVSGFEPCFSAESGALIVSSESAQRFQLTPTALLQDLVDDSFASRSSARVSSPRATAKGMTLDIKKCTTSRPSEACFSAESDVPLASAEKVQNDQLSPMAWPHGPIADSSVSRSSASVGLTPANRHVMTSDVTKCTSSRQDSKIIPIRQVFTASGGRGEWAAVPLSPAGSPRC